MYFSYRSNKTKQLIRFRIQSSSENHFPLDQMGCFSSGSMTDPFTHDSDVLLNIATRVVLLEDVAQTLLRSTERGRQQMSDFIEKRINSNSFPT